MKGVSGAAPGNVVGLAPAATAPSTEAGRVDGSPLERNQRIEKAVIEHIASHPAARETLRALTATLIQTFVKAHGELKGWAEIVQAASRPHDSNRNGSGVLSPRFDVVGSVGWNAAAIRATSRTGTLREKGTLFTNLMLSDNFKRLLERALSDPALQRKLSGLVDLDYLQATQGNLYKVSGWTAKAGDSRQQAGTARYQAAATLDSTEISARELAFHRHNPVNQPGNQARVGFATPALRDDELQVLRGYGSHVWTVNPHSEFARQAREFDKPVVAGPSGTASRFMAVARFIAPGCQDELGIKDERGLRELVRYAAYGYFGQDNHHSMLEVNLGAASHGLDEQWDERLYTEPFSHVIQGRRFSVDNQAQQHIARQADQAPRSG